MRNSMTVRQLIQREIERLERCDDQEAQADVYFLYEFLTKGDPVLDVVCKKEAAEELCRNLEQLVERRAAGEPVQYIAGVQFFMGLSFGVTPAVLIPRADTEILCETVIQEAKQREIPLQVLDLCCGSGCIGVAVAAYTENCQVTCADVEGDALRIAQENAQKNGVSVKMQFVQSDLLEHCGKYDMIACNPPYIPSEVIDTLDRKVKHFEPRVALDGGRDGLDFYRKIAREAPLHLRQGGKIALEIGYDQREAVCALLAENGFTEVVCRRDYGGNDRVIIGRIEDSRV